MKAKNEIGLVLKNELEKINIPVDDIVWLQIEAKLKKQKRNKKIRLTLISVAFLAGFLGVFFFFKKNKTATYLPIEKNASINNKSEFILNSKVGNKKNKPLATSEPERESIQRSTQESTQLHSNKIFVKNKKSRTETITTVKKHFNDNIKYPIKLQQIGYHLNINNQLEPLDIKLKDTSSYAEKPFSKKLSLTLVGGINSYNSYSKGNSLNENLFNNYKSNTFSFNYGFYLNYNLNEKLLIRIGLHHLKLNYTTNKISIGEQAQLTSIYDIRGINTDYSGSNITSLFNNDNAIKLTEEITYLEIPFEIKYLFFKRKKNQLGFMAGYSQLFIQKSGIFGASTNTKKFKMGSSNNVYDVNVSLNLGISNRLKLTNKLFLDVELNYKNYFRTYNSNTNLKPFTVNFQTGITYEFDGLK